MVRRLRALENVELVMHPNLNRAFWAGKKVLITGHTGFKGSWMSLALLQMGAEVFGVALEPNTKPSMFEGLDLSSHVNSNIVDIRNLDDLKTMMTTINPDILIHMAAQPLVRQSYADPITTFETNVMGTVNVLEAARQCSNMTAILVVTTDKCYENKEWVWGYKETDTLGGFDPYSNSKACAELVCSAYRSSYFQLNKVALATARAGNVIGGGDWSEDRLIPDLLKSIDLTKDFEVRAPEAVRPWQHVIEPINGYLMLIEKLYQDPTNFSEAWNFGPSEAAVKPVKFIIEYLAAKMGHKKDFRLQLGEHPHETNFLTLNNSKAKMRLGWQPRWNIEESLDLIIEWHTAFRNKKNMIDISVAQIQKYHSSTHKMT